MRQGPVIQVRVMLSDVCAALAISILLFKILITSEPPPGLIRVDQCDHNTHDWLIMS